MATFIARPNLVLGLAAGWLALSGCIASGTRTRTPPDQTATDIDQWNRLAARLDGGRTVFRDTGIGGATGVGNQLYWLDTSAFNPVLNRYDHPTGAKIRYGFSIGDSDLWNYRASGALVVTADPLAAPVEYHAYDANATATELAATTLANPLLAGTRWAAYAVSDGTVYFVDDGTPGATALLKWVPGQGAPPAQVTTLESAGAQIGSFEDFGVSGDTMVFIETGRIWKLSISANRAVWLGNTTEVSGDVDLADDGVMFSTASGLMFFSYATNALTNVSDRIDANPYQINATYASAAKYVQDFSRYKGYVLYIGQYGLFGYDLAKDVIVPILLSPNSSTLRIDYQTPVALDDGTAFVVGLTSTDGAVGADGPTYEVDLTTLLP
ncbi:MAG TPA: hypothetical protein VKQ32_02660 [Polyangia bacterium]|nr:hypothetical protein [Polyangia bacterium]